MEDGCASREPRRGGARREHDAQRPLGAVDRPARDPALVPGEQQCALERGVARETELGPLAALRLEPHGPDTFVGIAARGNGHIVLLSQLATVLLDPEKAAALRAAEEPDRVYELLAAEDEDA